MANNKVTAKSLEITPSPQSGIKPGIGGKIYFLVIKMERIDGIPKTIIERILVKLFLMYPIAPIKAVIPTIKSESAVA